MSFNRRFAASFAAYRSSKLWWHNEILLRKLLISGAILLCAQAGAFMQIGVTMIILVFFLVRAFAQALYYLPPCRSAMCNISHLRIKI